MQQLASVINIERIGCCGFRSDMPFFLSISIFKWLAALPWYSFFLIHLLENPHMNVYLWEHIQNTHTFIHSQPCTVYMHTVFDTKQQWVFCFLFWQSLQHRFLRLSLCLYLQMNLLKIKCTYFFLRKALHFIWRKFCLITRLKFLHTCLLSLLIEYILLLLLLLVSLSQGVNDSLKYSHYLSF